MRPPLDLWACHDMIMGMDGRGNPVYRPFGRHRGQGIYEMVGRTLQDFPGTWRITREISDHRAGRVITGEGQAWLTPVPGGLDYAETLILALPGQRPVVGARRYLWRGSGARITVAFDDGCPFHTILLDQVAPRDRHHCAPDIYDVFYDFAVFPAWSVTWTVSGPRKNYVMTTQYAAVAN